MERIGGLGKHMTQSPRAVAGSQPNPACGLGLCQQQSNTLPKRLGTMNHTSSPSPPVAHTVHPNVVVLQASHTALCLCELLGAFRASRLLLDDFLVNLALP